MAGHLTEDDWAQIKSSVLSGLSVSEVARRFGISRAAIYKHFRTNGLEMPARPEGEAPPKPEQEAKPTPAPPRPKGTGTFKSAAAQPTPKHAPPAMQRKLPLSLQAQLRPVDENLRARMEIRQHQETRTEKLRGIVDLMLKNAMVAMTPVDDEDAKGLARQAKALNGLMPGGRDTLAAILGAMKGLIETLRTYELSIVDLRMIEKADQTKAKQESEKEEAIQALAGGNPEMPDFGALPTEELERIFEAAELLDNRRDRPAVPMPPSGPMIDHQADE